MFRIGKTSRWILKLASRARTVQTREDFIDFLTQLRIDYETDAHSWANTDIPSLLNAAAAWSHDSDRYYENMREYTAALSPWRLFADILMAARVYE